MDPNHPVTFTPEQMAYLLQIVHNTSASPDTQHSSTSPSLGASVGMCPVSTLAPTSSSPPYVERTQFALNSQIPSSFEYPLPPDCSQDPGDDVVDITGDVGTKKSVQCRAGNLKWGRPEDTLLISAWLNTSKDPIVSTNQKTNTFWEKITNYYNEHSNEGNDRLTSNLKSRWFRLQKWVLQFSACYKLILERRQSGASEMDILKCAHELYEVRMGGKFTCPYAWELLKHEPKFLAQLDKHQPAKRTSTTDPNTYDSVDLTTTPPSLTRPIGRDAAKRKGKEKSTSKSGNVERRKVKLDEMAEAAKEYAISQARQVDLQILLHDKTGMTEEQVRVHESMCRSIMAKYD